MSKTKSSGVPSAMSAGAFISSDGVNGASVVGFRHVPLIFTGDFPPIRLFSDSEHRFPPP